MGYKSITTAIALYIISMLAFGQIITIKSNNLQYISTKENTMSRVTGIGGIFIKAKDPAKLQNWYKQHLGIDVQAWGGTSFRWVDSSGNPTPGTTAWMIGDGNNFTPSNAPFMVNYRVSDLTALLTALRAEGCDVLEKTEESEYGKFGWVMDPEGNKIELWEPPAGE
ncbi:MAG: putative enzyme related to lactoylglutathione lyase [Paraglaciecola sp.]|jgi:predicted enzyme related to lactoylglutathione lyase